MRSPTKDAPDGYEGVGSGILWGQARLRFGAVVAFVVSATNFSFLGIGSGFWALVVALLALLVAKRRALFAYWRPLHPPARAVPQKGALP